MTKATLCRDFLRYTALAIVIFVTACATGPTPAPVEPTGEGIATREQPLTQTPTVASAPANTPLPTPAARVTPTRPATPGVFASAVTYYVALNGNDGWNGAMPAPNAAHTDGPFSTFERARAQVQSLDKAGLKQVTIQFRAGMYFLPATEQFAAADSGTANTKIVYENYPGESPVISGGVRVQNWSNVGGNTWQTTLPASTRYFENLFYNGVRRLRPRLGSYLGSYFRISATVYLNAPGPPATAPDPNCSIYVAGKGWECFDRFQYNPADPIGSSWRNLATPAYGRTASPHRATDRS